MEGRDGEGRRVNKMKKRGQRYLGSSEIIGREGPDMLSQATRLSNFHQTNFDT